MPETSFHRINYSDLFDLSSIKGKQERRELLRLSKILQLFENGTVRLFSFLDQFLVRKFEFEVRKNGIALTFLDLQQLQFVDVAIFLASSYFNCRDYFPKKIIILFLFFPFFGE